MGHRFSQWKINTLGGDEKTFQYFKILINSWSAYDVWLCFLFALNYNKSYLEKFIAFQRGLFIRIEEI